jgi:hypothetical protein
MTVLAQMSANTNMDLRQTISRRLMTILAERRRLEGRINILTEVEKELRGLLEEEHQPALPNTNRRILTAALAEETVNQNARIKEFIQKQLSAGVKTADELVDLAQKHGFDFGEKSARRVLHFNLLNLKNSGMIEKEGEAWKLSDRFALFSKLMHGRRIDKEPE